MKCLICVQFCFLVSVYTAICTTFYTPGYTMSQFVCIAIFHEKAHFKVD